MNNRRNRLDLMYPAEKAIHDAMQEVEKLPADVGLTDAVILLQKAKDKVSDYLDMQKFVPSSETTNDEEDDPGGGGNHPKKPGNP